MGCGGTDTGVFTLHKCVQLPVGNPYLSLQVPYTSLKFYPHVFTAQLPAERAPSLDALRGLRHRPRHLALTLIAFSTAQGE